MLEGGTIADKSSASSTTSGAKTTRKFINSAIYVEKPLSTYPSTESCSMGSYSNEDIIKTKRCTCSVDHNSCPCHGTKYLSVSEEAPIKPKVPKPENKSKRSQYTENTETKNRVTKKCTTKKDKKKVEAIDANKEREALLEQERSNFKKWLLNKKKIEREALEKKKKQFEEQQLKELEKEKRHLESQLNFQLWLKKKEEEDLERKIKKQIEIIGNLERKESQVKGNEKAFRDWLKSAKNKTKPAPLNRGLESLYSTTSITFVNPNPWNPLT